jgi:hypothetical protein
MKNLLATAALALALTVGMAAIPALAESIPGSPEEAMDHAAGSFDPACMNERGHLSDVYQDAKSKFKRSSIPGLTKRYHSAMKNLVAFGDALELEISQGYTPHDSCAGAGGYAIGKMLQTGDAGE